MSANKSAFGQTRFKQFKSPVSDKEAQIKLRKPGGNHRKLKTLDSTNPINVPNSSTTI